MILVVISVISVILVGDFGDFGGDFGTEIHSVFGHDLKGHSGLAISYIG